MTNFYSKKEDRSSQNIAAAAAHLNKKPARQGGNQSLENVTKPKEKETSKKA